MRRATLALDLAMRHRILVNIGLDHLTLARVHPSGSSESKKHLDEAVSVLRQSGAVCYLPLALLARATHKDLIEVEAIATRSGMRLYLADYHILQAQFFSSSDRVKALQHLYDAEVLVNEAGYRRRIGDISALRERLSC